MNRYYVILILIIVLLVVLIKSIKIGKYISPQYSNSKYEALKLKESEIEIWNFEGNREHILLINGDPGVPTYMEPIAKRLNEKGFNVILYNQRGTGNSVSLNKKFSTEDHVNDIEGIRKHLKISKLHIIGHSWGGLLAQLYNSEYPSNVKSLLLISSSTGIGDDWKAMEKNVMKYNKSKLSSMGWLQLGVLSGVGQLKGKLGNLASRKMMNTVWKNYFKNPSLIDDADSNWLNGIFSNSIIKTT